MKISRPCHRNIPERQEWVEAICTAKEDYLQKRMTFAKDGSDGAPHESFHPGVVGELGDIVPIWVPNNRVAMCQTCQAEFSLLVRRHHCRACGKVVAIPTANILTSFLFRLCAGHAAQAWPP